MNLNSITSFYLNSVNSEAVVQTNQFPCCKQNYQKSIWGVTTLIVFWDKVFKRMLGVKK